MLNLIELFNFLNSKTNNIDEYINSLKNYKRLDSKMYTDYGFSATNFSYNDTLNNLIFCLMYAKILPGYSKELIDGTDSFDRQKPDLGHKIISDMRKVIVDLINDNKLIAPVNKKKMVQLISANQYNHELILTIATIYNTNIFVFYKDMNLFKVYYPDDEFYCNKPNVFLQYNRDVYSKQNTFQLLTQTAREDKNLLEWDNIKEIVNENISHIYPLGFEENKLFKINTSTYDNIPNTYYQTEVQSVAQDDSDNDEVNISDYLFRDNSTKTGCPAYNILDIKLYNNIVNGKFQ